MKDQTNIAVLIKKLHKNLDTTAMPMYLFNVPGSMGTVWLILAVPKKLAMEHKVITMKKKLVPIDFTVPSVFKNNHFYLEILGTKDIEIDYITVRSNLKHLKGTFGPYNNWPLDGLTKKYNYDDLKWHESEFTNRTSFAYSARSLKNEYLGGIYIYPSFAADFDAMVIMWVKKDSSLQRQNLYNTIKEWIVEVWPFNKPAFPGIEINWETLDMSNIKQWKDYYM